MNSQRNLERWARAWRRSARRWEAFAPALRWATGWRIWNPAAYGETWHARFRRCYPPSQHPLLIFGLNPGPYGMAQTGIPFTDLRRLESALPDLALELREAGERMVRPGLAPRSLHPFLERSFESSSVRVYRFLERAWGSAEIGWKEVVVANPCPLLFMDPVERKNRTPADLAKAARLLRGRAAAHDARERSDRLRREGAAEALEALEPRGVVLLGRNVQATLGPPLQSLPGGESRRLV